MGAHRLVPGGFGHDSTVHVGGRGHIPRQVGSGWTARLHLDSTRRGVRTAYSGAYGARVDVAGSLGHRFRAAREWLGLAERVIILGLPLVVAAETGLALSADPARSLVWRALASAGLLAVFAVSWTAFRRRARDTWGWLAVLAVAVGAIAALAVLGNTGQGWALGAMAVAVLGASLPVLHVPVRSGRRWRGFGAVHFSGYRDFLATIGLWGAFLALIGPTPTYWASAAGAVQIVALACFAVPVLYRLPFIVTLARGAEETSSRNAELTERSALARELHDILAHTLAGLAVELEGSRLLAERERAAPQLRAHLEHAADLARTGLAEARGALAALRDGSRRGPDELGDLVADFETTTGLPCSLRVLGPPRPLPPEASVALYRTTQEALTNVMRHARAARVEVRLTWRSGTVVLTVRDHGTPGGRPSAGGEGYGLSGMRERAELAHGSLRAGPTKDGFLVELALPTSVDSRTHR